MVATHSAADWNCSTSSSSILDNFWLNRLFERYSEPCDSQVKIHSSIPREMYCEPMRIVKFSTSSINSYGMKYLLKTLFALITLAIVTVISGTVFYGTKTVHDLLDDNQKLKEAIATLTHEDQIGFAKVIRQEMRDGRLYTTLRFVETARDDMLRTVLEKEYEVEGDVIHFDALVVTFTDQAVMDGKARSLYLWRRVYGEHMTPAEGYEIETPGTHPERYAGLLTELRIPKQKMFWEAVWDLANDPEALRGHGIKAIYGNAVYKRLRPGLIYVFKIGSDGQVYPETVLDM